MEAQGTNPQKVLANPKKVWVLNEENEWLQMDEEDYYRELDKRITERAKKRTFYNMITNQFEEEPGHPPTQEAR
jgi:hypothetical protein